HRILVLSECSRWPALVQRKNKRSPSTTSLVAYRLLRIGRDATSPNFTAVDCESGRDINGSFADLRKRSDEIAAEEIMLNGKKVAILVADGFEQVEMTEPRKALDEAGAQTQIVSPAWDKVQAWKHFDKGDQFQVDVPLDQAVEHDFD